MATVADAHHEHGHLKLQYQPGLPLPNGKLFMWLFLSTEIMFFAALIGMYIVLRFGAPPGRRRTTFTYRTDRRLQYVCADLLQRDDRAVPGGGPGQ